MGGGSTARTPIADVSSLSRCLNAGGMGRQDYETETLIPTIGGGFDVAGSIGASHGNVRADEAWTNRLVAHSLRGDGFDASEDGTGRGTPLVHVQTIPIMRNGADTPAGHSARSGDTKDEYVVPIAFGWQNSSQQGASASASASHTPTLDKSKVPAIGFDLAQITSKVNRNRAEDGLPQPPIVAGGSPHVASTMQVRRLTPRECERLQGFPDDYTLVQHRNTPAADGPRYKALGNSMAVPVMAWIGRRIAMVEELCPE